MNDDIREMINIYNTYDYDWMGDKINNPSDLTRHHIVKRQYDGESSLNNYALLTENSHHLIHYLEINYNKEYNYINELLLKLNRSGLPPDEEYYNEMNSIMKKVRKSIKNSKRKRNVK